MYAEDDVLVPPAAFEYIHKHWRVLHDSKQIPCFVRVVVDAKHAQLNRYLSVLFSRQWLQMLVARKK
jgi:hypothetical protein